MPLHISHAISTAAASEASNGAHTPKSAAFADALAAASPVKNGAIKATPSAGHGITHHKAGSHRAKTDRPVADPKLPATPVKNSRPVALPVAKTPPATTTPAPVKGAKVATLPQAAATPAKASGAQATTRTAATPTSKAGSVAKLSAPASAATQTADDTPVPPPATAAGTRTPVAATTPDSADISATEAADIGGGTNHAAAAASTSAAGEANAASSAETPDLADAFDTDPSADQTALLATLPSQNSPTAPSVTASAAPIANPTAPLAEQTAEAAPPETPPPSTPPAPPTIQIGVSLMKSAVGLEQQVFSLQLRPERLGSVDVRLELDRQGHAHATFTAEHADTLQLLQHDVHHLVTALKQAGLDADPSSLSFSLKDQSQQQPSFGQQRGASGRPGLSGGRQTAAAEAVVPPTIASNRLYDIHA